jgi:pilus assembly protein CpaF
MLARLFERAQSIEEKLKQDERVIYSFQNQIEQDRLSLLEQVLETESAPLPEEEKRRLQEEFTGWGPLAALAADPEVSEILVNAHDSIWFEKKGVLHRWEDQFISELSYQNFLDRLLVEAEKVVSKDCPVAEGRIRDFRLHYVGKELTLAAPHLSLRRLSFTQQELDTFVARGWCTEEAAQTLRQIILGRSNFLVIGGTGSGKTTLLSALMNLIPKEQRVCIIEDTMELPVPNPVSFRMLTRHSLTGELRDYDQTALLKNALRMRPDRIIMGEMRGSEAKDFLLALSTGHDGSGGSLHAGSATQAMIRLEMLIQMGAPQWSLEAIRRLIHMCIHYVIQVGRDSTGQRRLLSIQRVSSLEEQGLTLETCYQWSGSW